MVSMIINKGWLWLLSSDQKVCGSIPDSQSVLELDTELQIAPHAVPSMCEWLPPLNVWSVRLEWCYKCSLFKSKITGNRKQKAFVDPSIHPNLLLLPTDMCRSLQSVILTEDAHATSRLGYLSFIAQNDACAEVDARRLFIHFFHLFMKRKMSLCSNF